MPTSRPEYASSTPVHRLRKGALSLTKSEIKDWAVFLEEDEDAVQLLFNIFGDEDYADEDSISQTTAALQNEKRSTLHYLDEQDKLNYAVLKNQLTLQIKRAAFEQNDVDLMSPLTDEDLKSMVAVLTHSPWYKVKRYENRIAATLTRLLLKCIRPSVRAAYAENPRAFAPHSGFLYTASDEYGNGTTYWCQLSIPALFKQGEELEMLALLRENSTFAAQQLAKVDNCILRHREAKVALIEQEVKFATRLRDNLSDKTWLGLLKRWPTWFIGLYEYKFKKTLFKHEYDDKTFFRSLGIRYRYTDTKCGLYEQYLFTT